MFATHEKKYGGRLPIQMPLNNAARLLATLFLITSLICSLTLLFQVDAVNQALPWTLPPLVGGLIGVLFMTHTAAYAWALWDGDWLRVRPIFWQAPATGLLFILLPLLHPSDLRSDVGNALTLYYTLAGLVVLASFSLIISYRTTEQKVPRHA